MTSGRSGVMTCFCFAMLVMVVAGSSSKYTCNVANTNGTAEAWTTVDDCTGLLNKSVWVFTAGVCNPGSMTKIICAGEKVTMQQYTNAQCTGTSTNNDMTNGACNAVQAPVDSSASSGSGTSSASLGSSGSAAGGSMNTGSSASDSSGSASSGSTASGSWGSVLQIWQWLLILGLCCCCLAGAGAGSMMGGKKPKKKKSKKSAPAAPAPKPAAPEAVAEPLMSVPPLMPLATTSSLIPSYSMVQQAPQYTYMQQPATTSYMQPQQFAYAQQPQQAYTYAAPATMPYGTTQGMVV